MHLPSPSQRLERLISRVTLGVSMLVGAIAAVGLALLTDATTPEARAARIAVPVSFAVAAALAYAAGRLGRARLGALILVVCGYLSIVNYAFVSELGFRSYTLSLFNVLIILAALLVGPRAGLLAAALGVATAAVLYAIDAAGGVFAPALPGAANVNNILLVHCSTFIACGAIVSLFSKAFQETLRTTDAQERRFRQLLDVTPLGYLLVRDGRIVLANPVAAGFVGRGGPDALIGVEPGDCAAALATATQRLAVGEASKPVEVEFGAGASAKRLVQAQALGIDTVDGAAQLLVLRDVTEERTAAAAMAESRRAAESASQAKSEFVANMSHEIRTPLNAIIGLSELARDPALDPERRREYLAKVGLASQALLEIVSDVLDMSKIEVGAMTVESIAFDPRAELDNVMRLHGGRAADKGLVLSAQVEPVVPAFVRGDPVRLRQVAGNFVSNAVKFTAQGRVSVRLLYHESERLRIEVEDSGIGIDAATQSRLFQPFAQADSSTTRRFGGTGLGLSLSRQLVALMGGRLGVESAPGRGSLFWAEWPMPVAPAPGPAAVPPVRAVGDGWAGGGRRVLVVEDNAVNRMVARAVLERLGFEVVEAHDGQAALDHFAPLSRPDCEAVLMDLQMPGLDGCQTTVRLRERFPADELPIIAMTAAVMAENRESARAAGMNDFVAKPFEVRQLEAVLRRWIQPGTCDVAAAFPGTQAPGAR